MNQKFAARRLLCILFVACLSLAQNSFAINAQTAHEFIKDQQPQLLGDDSQLVSLYYFGQHEDSAIVGLERVGDDYLPIRWLLIFKGERLLGWYYPCDEFPAKFDKGHLIFPKGSGVKSIYIYPEPPAYMEIKGHRVAFKFLPE